MNNSTRFCMSCRRVQATGYCDCRPQHTYLCFDCFSEHSRQPGLSHALKTESPQRALSSSASMANSNEYCVICKSRQATCICCCQPAYVPLCEECISAHIGKNSDIMPIHLQVPIHHKEKLNNRRYIETLMRRKLRIGQRTAELQLNIERIGTCMVELQQKSLTLIEHVQQYRDKLLEQLTKAREELEALFVAATSEAQEGCYDESYKPRELLASMLLAEDDQGLERSFFDYFLHFDPGNLTAALELQFEVTNFSDTHSGPSLQVPWITSNSLKLYDPQLRSWGPVWKFPKTFIDNHSSILALPDGTWLASGSTSSLRQVLRLDPANKRIADFAPLKVPRFGHGLLYWKHFVYAFGGYELKSCERINFSTGGTDWEALPDMTVARKFFNPCAHGCFVYLCGGDGTNTVEFFDTISKRFSLLHKLELPYKSSTFSAVHKGKLLVFQNDRVLRWTLNSTEAPEMLRKSVTDSNYCFSSVGGLAADRQVFIAMFYKSRVFQVDLESLASTKVSV